MFFVAYIIIFSEKLKSLLKYYFGEQDTSVNEFEVVALLQLCFTHIVCVRNFGQCKYRLFIYILIYTEKWFWLKQKT